VSATTTALVTLPGTRSSGAGRVAARPAGNRRGVQPTISRQQRSRSTRARDSGDGSEALVTP
jgi:hypothetical protein